MALSPDGENIWHAAAIAEVLAARQSSIEGLSEAEAQRRLAEFGPNRLPKIRKRGPLRRFLAQFHDPLIYVLIGASVITLLLGHFIGLLVPVLVGFTMLRFQLFLNLSKFAFFVLKCC